MSRSYSRLEIKYFGEHLLLSGDLDPVYIALHASEFDEAKLARWLVAYWCFYHCGVASYMADFKGEDFWGQMMTAAMNTSESPAGGRWPRGSERRHFRGGQATSCIAHMSKLYPSPELLVREIIGDDFPQPTPFDVMSERVKKLPRFGPWISFKVCDMMDRLDLRQVSFDKAAVFMFDTPVEAALMLWRQHHNLPDSAQPKTKEIKNQIIDEVVAQLKTMFKDFQAPPLGDRPVDLQEVETILCKWKSHMNGHYPLNNDIIEIREGVQEWCQVSETAKIFLYNMPQPLGEENAA